MKKIFLLLSIALISLTSRAQNILYIGNSYTYYNDSPAIFDSLARSQGRTPCISKFTKGGYTMQRHICEKECRDLIRKGGYDIVILQDQSVNPALIGTKDAGFVIDGMREMIEFVRTHNPQARIILEITWGRRDGDNVLSGYKKYAEKYPKIFFDYSTMQAALTRGVKVEAMMFGTEYSDVGTAWSQVREQKPNLKLYVKDGSHPSYAGSYLAATVIYTSVYGKPLRGKVFNGRLAPRTARFLRRTAWKNRQTE